MIFKEFGDQSLPTIILLHGGGLSWWSLSQSILELENDYHLITPIIDGHGENSEETFISIEDSAEKLIRFIDQNLSGSVFTIGGMSLGAQIVTEVLSIRPNIAKVVIIESALVRPIRYVAPFIMPLVKLFYGLIKFNWYSRLQAWAINVPKIMYDEYYRDITKMSKASLINILVSNMNYELQKEIGFTRAKVLIIVGEKEPGFMKKSAWRLQAAIANSELYVAPKLMHGEFSLAHQLDYVRTIRSLMKDEGVLRSFATPL